MAKVKIQTTEVHEGRGLKPYIEVKANHNVTLKKSDKCVPFGGLQIPEKAWMNHFVITGSSGSGKTITFNLILKFMIPQITSDSGISALIYDPKVEMLPYLYGMNVSCDVINTFPFDATAYAWDASYDITSPAAIEAFATSFFPLNPKGGGNDEFFNQAAQGVLTGVIEALNHYCPYGWTLRDVFLLIAKRDYLFPLLNSLPQTQHHLELFGGVDGVAEKQAAGVMASIVTKIRSFTPIIALIDRAYQEGRRFSLKDNYEAGGSILLLGKSEKYHASLNPFNNLLIELCSQIALDRGERKGLASLFVLDEATSLGKISKLLPLVQEGRSKGVSIIMGFQSIETLRELYGEKNANAIVGQFRHKAFCRMEDNATAKWASELIGVVRQKAYKEGSMSLSLQAEAYRPDLEQKDAVLASEFFNIPPVDFAENIGLTGYYLKATDIYKHTNSIPHLKKHLPRPVEGIDAFIPQDEQAQYLRPMTVADLQRLNLGDVIDGSRLPQSSEDSFNSTQGDEDFALPETF